MDYSQYRQNSKRVESYVNSMADKASQYMEETASGSRLFTSMHPNGDLNYLYMIKQPCGRIDQYTKFVKKDSTPKDSTTPTEVIVPNAPTPSPDRNANSNLDLMPLTQPNFDGGALKEEQEEEGMEEKTVLDTVDEKSKGTKFEFDSHDKYEKAVAETRRDEATKYDALWWSKSGCVHCGDSNLCHIHKFGAFCINVANATRQGSDKEDRKKLLNAFCDAYQYVTQYARYIKEDPIGIHRQIVEDDLENLPHCTYRLMDNWLKAIKRKNGSEKTHSRKRNNDDEDHDGKQNKKQRTIE